VTEGAQEVDRQVLRLTAERGAVQLQLAAQRRGGEAEGLRRADQVEDGKALQRRSAPIHEGEARGSLAVQHVSRPEIAVHRQGSRGEAPRCQMRRGRHGECACRAVGWHGIRQCPQRDIVARGLAGSAVQPRDLQQPPEHMAQHPPPIEPAQAAAARERPAVRQDGVGCSQYATGVERLENGRTQRAEKRPHPRGLLTLLRHDLRKQGWRYRDHEGFAPRAQKHELAVGILRALTVSLQPRRRPQHPPSHQTLTDEA